MSDLGERGLGLAVKMGRHHLVLDTFGRVGRSAIALLFLLLVITAVKIGWAFMFVGTAML
jgi:hypothetical protein